MTKPAAEIVGMAWEEFDIEDPFDEEADTWHHLHAWVVVNGVDFHLEGVEVRGEGTKTRCGPWQEDFDRLDGYPETFEYNGRTYFLTGEAFQ